MNSDPELLLQQLTPRRPDPDVRARVLGRIEPELESGAGATWGRWCTVGIAAGILLGLALNAWITWRHEKRLAELIGPPRIPVAVREIVQLVESVTDKPTAEWLEQHELTVSRRSASLAEHTRNIEKFLRELDDYRKDEFREKNEKDSQDRSHRPGYPCGALADRECRLDLGYGIAA